MSVDSLAVFALALAVAAGSPGPSIAALVSRVLQGGAASVIPFLAAMWIGEAAWLTAAILGLSAIAEMFHQLFVVIRYLGIAYLLWLAWQMWHAPVEAGPEPLPRAGSASGMFLSGLAVTIGNPKIMVFYLALLPGLVDMASIGIREWASLVGVLFAVLAGLDLAWVALASGARKFLRSTRVVRTANRISAGTMAAAAGFLAMRD